MQTTLLAILTLLTFQASAGSLPQQEWHTRPDRWREPRNFQTPFDPRYERSLSMTHQPIESDRPPTKVFSPNKAYWFAFDGPLPAALAPKRSILIFNERPYLIRLAATKDDPDYVIKRIEWVNEKLVYIEVWWGAVLGSCFIFDVEKELMVYREMVNDGSPAFQQWKAQRKND